jgi:pimeloyl-ACP methyl ester carboxylesterase
MTTTETTTADAPEQLSVDGVKIDLREAGEGRPLLFLHGVEGVDPEAPWFRGLAAQHRLIVASPPGFGHSERPEEFRTIADLAYFHLELADQLGLEDAVLAGASFGGWLAAEMAVRSTARFSRLVLIDPLGIKVGDRMERHITDMHALSKADLAKVLYADPALGEVDYSKFSDAELLAISRSEESFAFYGWKPYMNNPGLRRWLRRIRIPTLLIWGESDGVLGSEYAEAFAAELPSGRLEVVPGAGHYPHIEQPERSLALIEEFIDEKSAPESAADPS